MSKNRDIATILGRTEKANTTNIALSTGGLDSASVVSLVDSSYVAAREADAGGGGGVDSATDLGPINVYGGLNKCWWHIDGNNTPTIDDSFNLSSATDATGYTYVTFSNTMTSNKWTCVLTSEKSESIMSIFGSFETTTECYFRCRHPHTSTNQEPNDVGGILTGDLA